MSEFSHLKNKLLAEQVEDQIYHQKQPLRVRPERLFLRLRDPVTEKRAAYGVY